MIVIAHETIIIRGVLPCVRLSGKLEQGRLLLAVCPVLCRNTITDSMAEQQQVRRCLRRSAGTGLFLIFSVKTAG